MKRFLLLFAFLVSALPLQAQWLKQSTATTVNFKLTTIATGADNTGATVTSITVKLAKQSDTSSSTVTSITCAASGSSNDCVHIAAGLWNLELTTGNTDTLGRMDICALYTGDYTDCVRYQVVPAGLYDFLVTTGPAAAPTNFSDLSITASTGRVDVAKVGGTTQTAGDIVAVLALLDTAPRGVAYSNFPIWMMSSSTGAGVASLTNITCRITKDGGAWATTTDTTETEVGGTGNGRGKYLLDLTGTEMTADTISVECESATANVAKYRTTITTQH